MSVILGAVTLLYLGTFTCKHAVGSWEVSAVGICVAHCAFGITVQGYYMVHQRVLSSRCYRFCLLLDKKHFSGGNQLCNILGIGSGESYQMSDFMNSTSWFVFLGFL